MSTFSERLDEIETLMVFSSPNSNKSLAYSALVHLQQEQSSTDPTSLQSLAERSRTLIPLIVADISNHDEEIAAQALKCLGFFIYHPVTVAAIPVNAAALILHTLAKVITTTKMKSVCNLGVWCISMQGFSGSILSAHFNSLLKAVVYAIDNPMGSLSTTFEAVQAAMKLASQLTEMMKETSHIWAPSIYRRLLSSDKRERDIVERCLLKLKPVILPATLSLSKGITLDMKQRLIMEMKEMLKQGRKVQMLQAWQWFIRIMGNHAMKSRSLLNDMLKNLEHTFSDRNAQVQMASLVAWEALIDAMVEPPSVDCGTDSSKEKVQCGQGSRLENGESLSNGMIKRIKLIMTPLTGIFLSRCDSSVHLSCFDTWYYLLHKLDIYVNDTSFQKLVLGPVFEAIFPEEPENHRNMLWGLCFELLQESVLAKVGGAKPQLDGQLGQNILHETSEVGPISSCNEHPIKWLPWKLRQVDSYLQILHTIVVAVRRTPLVNRKSSTVGDTVLMIFRYVLKGIQMEFKSPSTNYDDVMWGLNNILKFLKRIDEGSLSDRSRNVFLRFFLQLMQVIPEELEPSILQSPIYKLSLDIKYTKDLYLSNAIENDEVILNSSGCYMDMVSPIFYLTVYYFYVILRSTHDTMDAEIILQELHAYMKMIMSSYDSSEILVNVVNLLYENVGFICLKIWRIVANAFADGKGVANGFLTQQKAHGDEGSATVVHLLGYPFFVYSSLQKKVGSVDNGGCSNDTLVPSRSKLELEDSIEVWISLYGCVSSTLDCSCLRSFHEELCSTLSALLEKSTHLLGNSNSTVSSSGYLCLDLLLLFGCIVTCILERTVTVEVSPDGLKNQSNMPAKLSANSLCLVTRFMDLSRMKIRTCLPTLLSSISRFFSSLGCLTKSLQSKQDILMFVEIVSSPLLKWLSQMETLCKSINDQLEFLWAETLNCLLRCQPSVIFDSSYLKIQATLLEDTLDHPNPSIANPTIRFWNSSYGQQIKLDYPPRLFHILDKLSRAGRINLEKRTLPSLERCSKITTIPHGYKVTTTNARTSKRVGLLDGRMNRSEDDKRSPLDLKRKWSELTVHQKEVRRGQQGRERDCSGHGPGVRTYTNLGFSKENDDSQDSREIHDQEFGHGDAKNNLDDFQ